MTIATTPSAADLLVELDRLGVSVTLKEGRISLQPASRVPSDMLAAVRNHKGNLVTLLADPRRRWRLQAESVLANVVDPDLHECLQHLFDEREAIAVVDGKLCENEAGRLAYEQVLSELGHVPIRDFTP